MICCEIWNFPTLSWRLVLDLLSTSWLKSTTANFFWEINALIMKLTTNWFTFKSLENPLRQKGAYMLWWTVSVLVHVGACRRFYVRTLLKLMLTSWQSGSQEQFRVCFEWKLVWSHSWKNIWNAPRKAVWIVPVWDMLSNFAYQLHNQSYPEWLS